MMWIGDNGQVETSLKWWRSHFNSQLHVNALIVFARTTTGGRVSQTARRHPTTTHLQPNETQYSKLKTGAECLLSPFWAGKSQSIFVCRTNVGQTLEICVGSSSVCGIENFSGSGQVRAGPNNGRARTGKSRPEQIITRHSPSQTSPQRPVSGSSFRPMVYPDSQSMRRPVLISGVCIPHGAIWPDIFPSTTMYWWLSLILGF